MSKTSSTNTFTIPASSLRHLHLRDFQLESEFADLSLVRSRSSQVFIYIAVMLLFISGCGTNISLSGAKSINASTTSPVITSQPTSLTVTLGYPADFSVTALNGDTLHYQWSINSINVTGATSPNFTIPRVTINDNNSVIQVAVSNSDSITIISNSARLLVNIPAPPSITSEPHNQTVALGQSATFSVTADGGAPLSYQWQKSSVDIKGAISPDYTTPPTVMTDNNAIYSVIVSDISGNITSNSASLSVAIPAPPSITSEPKSQTVMLGQSATFTVTADEGEPLIYQWQKNSININGAIYSSYTTPPTSASDNNAHFSVIVSNAAHNITSNVAVLTVLPVEQNSYYIAVNGNDNGDGSEANPFATLQRAQLAMQKSSIKITKINAGIYYLSKPLSLTAIDDGETWEPVVGASVVISGGELLQGWSSEGGGIYSTVVSQPVGLDLAISGVRQMPADLGYNANYPYTSGWRVIPPNQTSSYNNTFNIYPSDLTLSVKPGAIIQVIDYERWTDEFTTIVSVDAANSTITVADPFDLETVSGLAGSWRILNDPKDIGSTGQFAYDPFSSKVYISPSDMQSPASSNVVAAQLSTLMNLDNVSNISISGFVISDTVSDRYPYSGAGWDNVASIMARKMSNSTISGITFLNIGNGISLSGSSYNTISDNIFTHAGGSALFVTAESNQNKIIGNSMLNLGCVNLGSTGVYISDSADNVVDSNTIDGSGRWGIALYPDDGISLTGNVISNNIIRNTSQQTSDSGAIYTWAGNSVGYVNEQTVITGNRIENVGGLLRKVSGS